MTEEIQSPIEEYLLNNSENDGMPLFETNNKNTDLKTDLTLQELNIINRIHLNSKFLESKGLKPIFDKFVNKLLRLKVSQDRKSRSEYVTVNQKVLPFDKQAQNYANFKTILDTKQ